VADRAEDAAWRWLLTELGFRLEDERAEGMSWRVDTVYLTITTSPNRTDAAHDRRRPGVNHLAFWGGSPAEVDAVMLAASGQGWRELYAERYPHAGGPEHYAGWLENAAGFKVEIVAE
jgi:catechol 2,3-dioxygenase-like lactoylglutathione lyase family enzyme